ncbi:exopolyphosphatase [Salisediminibacterium beveridgei]|uniref:exopolyphosphatase n=1 Tax=Salisediminibacterium beveridgei TaxID=632773 RepID=A0A1D7QUB9_9BACI|nr:exopolyphosphatase [Salisediminibacterium beveridgei]AOM82614.1 Exopolyphosphatase [Salisediminibacterium beveridgei]
MDRQAIGIIDIGSNSIRFVIYEVDEDACFKETQNLKVSARLSSYIDDTGEMSSEGIEMILHTLDEFNRASTGYNLTEVRAVATAAVRNAINQDEILEAVNTKGAFSIEVLSDYQEAYYGYLAVTNSTTLTEGITIDIGGGSTEITYFKDRELKQYHSFPFGAVTLKNQFVKGDTPTEDEMKAIQDFIFHSYDSLSWLKEHKVPVIGIGGTARNLATVHQETIDYPLAGLHEYRMTFQDVKEIREELWDMSNKKREKQDGLSKDRSDIIVPAISAIEELMDYVSHDEYIVSHRGLRDGLFYEHLLKNIDVTHFPNVIEESFYSLTKQFQLDEQVHRHLSILSAYLIQDLVNEGLTDDLDLHDRKLMQWGATVYYIGEAIHPEAKAQHSFYMLTNQAIDGLTHGERMAVAFIASFKSRSTLKQFAAPFGDLVSKDHLKTYELLGSILKLCYALNISKLGSVEKVEAIKTDKKNLQLIVVTNGPAYFEDYQANKYKKHLEKILKLSIHITIHNTGSTAYER